MVEWKSGKDDGLREKVKIGENGSSDWLEVDTMFAMRLEGEGGLWSSEFLPPPPRPQFVEEEISLDGLPLCDLCTWAWRPPFPQESSDGKQLSWVATLIAVSFVSALIGAVVMVTVIRCRKKLQYFGRSTSSYCLCMRREEGGNGSSVSMARYASRTTGKDPDGGGCPLTNGRRREEKKTEAVWRWISRRSQEAPSQLASSAPTAPENHYTLEESYPTNNGEALYAELDRDSCNSPAYENSGYAGFEADGNCVACSDPSSAYYSDLSDPNYEAVGNPSDVNKIVTIASDYV